MKRHVGARERRESGGQQELAEHDHDEPIVARQITRLCSDPGERSQPEGDDAPESIAHPTRRDLEDDDEQVVQRGQEDGAVEVEPGSREQHEHGYPEESVGERLVQRDQTKVALEPGAHLPARPRWSIWSTTGGYGVPTAAAITWSEARLDR